MAWCNYGTVDAGSGYWRPSSVAALDVTVKRKLPYANVSRNRSSAAYSSIMHDIVMLRLFTIIIRMDCRSGFEVNLFYNNWCKTLSCGRMGSTCTFHICAPAFDHRFSVHSYSTKNKQIVEIRLINCIYPACFGMDALPFSKSYPFRALSFLPAFNRAMRTYVICAEIKLHRLSSVLFMLWLTRAVWTLRLMNAYNLKLLTVCTKMGPPMWRRRR